MVALLKTDNQVRAKETVITPSIAASWLEKKAPNRKVSPRAVERYAADMRAGRWQSNGSTIVMGASGLIIDGQHRLEAIVKADLPVKMLVVSGVEDSAFSTIDSGRPRTTADVLTAMGYPYGSQVAASARMWLTFIDTGTFYDGPSAASAQEILAVAISKFDDFHAAINGTTAVRLALRGSVGVWVTLWLRLGDIDPLDRDAFFSSLATGADLKETNPLFVLRRSLLSRLNTIHGRQAPLPPNMLGAYLIKTWNKFRAHETATRVSWNVTEPFPEPI